MVLIEQWGYRLGSQAFHATGAAPESCSARFLRAAQICRIRDLNQLLVFSDLIKEIADLIHVLQKERGASAVFLGSSGAQFADKLAERTAESVAIEANVRARLLHVDEQIDRISSGARFFARIALGFETFDALARLRAQVQGLMIAPQDAVKAFTDAIASLLSIIFEAADIAANPQISQAMVALVNFIQGKEFAGQERATGSAGFSRGYFEGAELRRLHNLIAAQAHAFRVFNEFADAKHKVALQSVALGADSLEIERMRQIAFAGGQMGDLQNVSGQDWFEQCTRRIDAMKLIEDQLTIDLKILCAARLAEANQGADATLKTIGDAAPVALLIRDPDAALKEAGFDPGPGLYAMGGFDPRLMRSILDVVQAQSRRLHDVSAELESARTALSERKLVERAKSILMSARQLSEQDAYTLMRKTAMNQHKRIYEVAEAIISMADILK